MDNAPVKFEIDKKQLLRDILAPFVFMLLFVGLLGFSLDAFLLSHLTSLSAREHEDMRQIVVSSMSWALAGILVVYALTCAYTLNSTARKLVIGENSLDISTFWKEHNLRWTDVVEVKRLYHNFQAYLYVKTWDAQMIIVSPPLKPLETLEKELSARALDAVGAPQRPGQRPLDERKRELFFADVLRNGRIMLGSICIAAWLFCGYQFWMQIRDPEISVVGSGESRVTTGKKNWIYVYSVHNFGRDARGIEVQVSGDAFEKLWLKNPLVLVETQDETKLCFPSPIKNQARELLTLVPKGNGVWAATSKSIELKRENYMMIEAVTFMTSALCGEVPWERKQTVTLFADVPKAGKGTVKITVSPIGLPGGHATTELKMATSGGYGGATPIPSVGVPSSFPVPAYPGSQIALLSSWDIKLYSTASDKDIIAFYKSELKRRGWQTVESRDKYKATTLHAKKRKDKLSIEIQPLKEGSQIQLLLNFL